MFKRSSQARDRLTRSGSDATKASATGDTKLRHGPAAVHELNVGARYDGMMARWRELNDEAAELSKRLSRTMPMPEYIATKTRRDDIGHQINELQTAINQLKGTMKANRIEAQRAFERLFVIAAREYLPRHTWDELVEHALRFQADCIAAYETELDAEPRERKALP